MESLKPCPFCGGNGKVMDAFYSAPKSGIEHVEYWCGCSDCDVETAIHHDSKGSKEGAITIWNERKVIKCDNHDRLVEENAELREAFKEIKSIVYSNLSLGLRIPSAACVKSKRQKTRFHTRLKAY